MSTVIKVENLSKQYRLGQIGTGTISHDLNRWWSRMRGKEDPFLKIGEANDRTQKGNSDYVWALQNINFEVNKGDVLGVIGRNGAGKSTLLKILSKTTAPTLGSIKIKGRIASLLEVGTGFHPELSGRENIFLNGAILGMNKHEIKSKFDEIVDFSGVQRYVDTPVKRYSSGMYVRLAFSVAAHLEPEILVVDEVLAVGDVEFQKKCLGKMQDVNSKDGRTILFVSHNMGALKTLCSTGICLLNGKIAYSGGIQSAIDFYNSQNLSASQGESSLYIGKQSTDEQKAYIKKIELLNSKKIQRTNFDVHDEVTVVITINCLEKILGCTPIIDVNYNGSLLFKTFLADKNPEVLDGINKGEHTYSFTFPILLKKGIYSLSFHIGQLYNKDLDFVSEAITFHTDEINESLQFKSYSTERQGLIAINESWNQL